MLLVCRTNLKSKVSSTEAISLGFFPGVTVHYFLRDLALVVRAAGGSATRGGGGISPDG